MLAGARRSLGFRQPVVSTTYADRRCGCLTLFPAHAQPALAPSCDCRSGSSCATTFWLVPTLRGGDCSAFRSGAQPPDATGPVPAHYHTRTRPGLPLAVRITVTVLMRPTRAQCKTARTVPSFSKYKAVASTIVTRGGDDSDCGPRTLLNRGLPPCRLTNRRNAASRWRTDCGKT